MINTVLNVSSTSDHEKVLILAENVEIDAREQMSVVIGCVALDACSIIHADVSYC